jgi:hypothetical protein
MTGVTAIILKLEEIVKQYSFREKQPNQDTTNDHEVEYKLWPHPAKTATITEIENHEDASISAYTDGSKYQRGEGG